MTDNTNSFCAVLLAGGKSSRMGVNKAFLKMEGRTFLDIQLEKLCALNVNEILLSGDPDILSSSPDMTDGDKRIRMIPDSIKDKGPLGGLYSCFSETRCDHALVLSLDTPLISKKTLQYIILRHLQNKADATVLTIASGFEPLIAAYSTKTHSLIRKLIDDDKLSMKSLLNSINTSYIPFTGDPSELYNCNTKAEYEKLTAFRS